MIWVNIFEHCCFFFEFLCRGQKISNLNTKNILRLLNDGPFSAKHYGDHLTVFVNLFPLINFDMIEHLKVL